MYSLTQIKSLWEKSRNWLSDSYTWVIEKTPTLKWLGKAETLSPNTISSALYHIIRKELPTLTFSLEIKCLDRTSSAQLLRLPLKGQAPQNLALKVNRAFVHEAHKTSKEPVPNMSTCQGYPSRAQDRGSRRKLPSFSLYLEGFWVHTLQAAAWRSNF